MKVWFSTYQLVAQQFNSQIQKNKYRKGALLRIRFSDDLLGYSDLCPYPEMGDHPLEYELKQMVMLKPSRIAERSIYFAKMDAEARKQKKSLYIATEKIRNHFLVTDILSFDLNRIAALESQGYSEFKFKVGRDLVQETAKLEHVSNRISSSSKMRLDFNVSLTRDKFVDWFEKNQKWLRPLLDYIEDPFAYNAKEWREVSTKWNIPLALDLAADPITTQAEGAAVVVIKPAIQDADEIVTALKNKNKKFVFSHYMDFAVGQMFAYATAQRLAPFLGHQMLSCGLQINDLYQHLTFQNKVQSDGPFIIPPDGDGIGFETMFNNLDWLELAS